MKIRTFVWRLPKCGASGRPLLLDYSSMPHSVDEFEDPTYALQFARIECHYFMNNAFFKSDNWLIENLSELKNIPIAIVQGRYDVVCPMRSAWDLHEGLNALRYSAQAENHSRLRTRCRRAWHQINPG
jgi:pimeloyl-ACP methyl ester carboxylesterase